MKRVLKLLKQKKPIPVNEIEWSDTSPITLGWNKKGNYFHTIQRERGEMLKVWNFWGAGNLRTIRLTPAAKLIDAAYGTKTGKLATLRTDKNIQILSFTTHLKPMKLIQLDFSPSGLKFNHDEKELYVSGENNLYCFNLETMEKRLVRTFDSAVDLKLVLPINDGCFVINNYDLLYINHHGEVIYDFGKTFHQKVRFSNYDARTQKIFFVYDQCPKYIFAYDMQNRSIAPIINTTQDISGFLLHPEHSILGVQFEDECFSPHFFDFHKLYNTAA